MSGRDSPPRRATSISSASGIVPHRKNESRDARSRSLMRYALPGFAFAGVSSTRNTKCRLESIACSAMRTPPSKPPGLRALLVELHQLIHVGLRHRPAIRLRRQPFDDAPGARHVFLWRRRAAAEDGAPRRMIGHARRLERPDDAEIAQVRQRRDAVADADLRVGQRVVDRLDQIVFRALELLNERGRDTSRPGPHIDRRAWRP